MPNENTIIASETNSAVLHFFVLWKFFDFARRCAVVISRQYSTENDLQSITSVFFMCCFFCCYWTLRGWRFIVVVVVALCICILTGRTRKMTIHFRQYSGTVSMCFETHTSTPIRYNSYAATKTMHDCKICSIHTAIFVQCKPTDMKQTTWKTKIPFMYVCK